MIEASNQRGHLDLDGVNPLLQKSEVPKLRTFTTWDYLQTHYDYKIPMHHNGEELTNVYYRAVSERNISVVFIAPYSKNDTPVVEPEMYGNVLIPLRDRLGDRGYEQTGAVPMGNWEPARIAKVPVALGVVAAFIILLQILFNINNTIANVVFILGVLASILFYGLGIKEGTGNVLFNLAAIIVYPSLSISFILQNYRQIRENSRDVKFINIFGHGILVLAIAILITMIGALNEASFMSGTDYLLEINIFRGVKISQILPILMSVLIYAAYIGFNRSSRDTRVRIVPREIADVLGCSVKIWHAIIAGVMLVMVAILLLRGGNSNAEVPGIELLFRNILERYLPARPRTKAIFIGFPAVVLVVYLAYRNSSKILLFLVTILASIGFADICNTFSHIRTPFMMSVTRIFVEFAVAIVISLLLLILFEICRFLYGKYGSKSGL